jgi:2-phosphosulfolactate phosphatase
VPRTGSTASNPERPGSRRPEPGADPFDQTGFDLRFEWGPDGLHRLGPAAGAIVIVDVLRFTTAVSVAVGRGAEVLPYPHAGDDAETYAAQHNALLADGRRASRGGGGWSLSPTDLAKLPAGVRLVLPSPNGSALAFVARQLAPGAAVLAGCLRNASSVARRAAAASPGCGPIAVIAAGERWGGDTGALRPAVEDLLGAGAVLRALRVLTGVAPSRVSPEARAAMAAFDDARHDLGEWLLTTRSGRELVARGRSADVAAAASLDVDAVAPMLQGAAFVGVTPGGARHLR